MNPENQEKVSSQFNVHSITSVLKNHLGALITTLLSSLKTSLISLLKIGAGKDLPCKGDLNWDPENPPTAACGSIHVFVTSAPNET